MRGLQERARCYRAALKRRGEALKHAIKNEGDALSFILKRLSTYAVCRLKKADVSCNSTGKAQFNPKSRNWAAKLTKFMRHFPWANQTSEKLVEASVRGC